MKKLMTLTAALAVMLPWALGCGEGGDVATAPDLDALGAETISSTEIAASAFLDDLSEEDRAAVRAALQRAREAIHAIVERVRAHELTREEARAEIEAVHTALIDELSNYLTEEQINRLLHHRPGHPRPDLDLTDDQIAAIRELVQAFHAFVRDVKAQLANHEITAEHARALIHEEARETRAAFCEILTEEQQAKVPFCGHDE